MQKEIKINSEVQGIKDWVNDKISNHTYVQFWDVCDRDYEGPADAYQAIPMEYVREISPAKATNEWFIKVQWDYEGPEYFYSRRITFANTRFMPGLGGDGMAMMYDIY